MLAQTNQINEKEKDMRKMVNITVKIRKWGTEDNPLKDELWKIEQGKKQDNPKRWEWQLNFRRKTSTSKEDKLKPINICKY